MLVFYQKAVFEVLFKKRISFSGHLEHSPQSIVLFDYRLIEVNI